MQALDCAPAPDVQTTCPEAFDGSVPGAPPLVGPLGLIPLPENVELGRGTLSLGASSRIVAPTAAQGVATLLAEQLRASTGLPLPVDHACGGGVDIVLDLDEASSLSDEGYELEIECDRATLRAKTPAGLFYATQTLRELLPAASLAPSSQSLPDVTLPRVRIQDEPRFAWRGFMLDVARHFFSVDEVKRLIDLAALHKLNRVHLHLSDDQGWRVQIDSWPKLTSVGSVSQAGGGPGGFYTKADYQEIVSYAAERFIVLVPEIDMPGHTNAALASYPDELSESGSAPGGWPYTGTDVGFSSLWIGGPNTLDFVDDVVGELAAMTPGPYIHIGGDEAQSTSDGDYKSFIAAVEGVVQAHGKTMVGWADVARASLDSTSIAQYWANPDTLEAAVAQGLPVIMSPATNAYLDMKYSESTPIGQSWAGYVSVQQAYEWSPVSGSVPESAVLGVEAALWTEFVDSRADIDYLAFPRFAGHAEIAWSPASGRYWNEYRERLALHGARLDALGVGYFASSEVDW
jgi:hexosaminidase